MATNIVGRIDFQSKHLKFVPVTCARAAPPAYDKKCNCCAGRAQANKLPDSMDTVKPIIN